MDDFERIHSHIVSVWREPKKKFFVVGGRECMLVLTDKHIMFIQKTEAKMKWWEAVTQRQVLLFLRTKDTMIRHDGYDEESLKTDLENKKNIEISFKDINDIYSEEKEWGSVLVIEYQKNNKNEKYQCSIAQDWVKYPIKEPTKFMKVDWSPFIQFIKERV